LKELFRYKNEQTYAGAEKILLISLGGRNAGACVTNSEGNQLYNVVYFCSDAGDNVDLQSFLAQTGFTKEKYSKIVIGLDYEADLLVTEQTKNWVTANFPSAMLPDQFEINLKNNAGDGLYADFKTDQLSVVLIKDSKLLLVANYDYETSADLLWHFLNICDHFSLSPKKVQLKLSGFIEKDSALYKELYQYFLHLEFDNADWGACGDYPAHYFSSFNKLVRCAL
jgi:hypothetical protein